nr:hypothetical protein CPGR_04919 [Mycolicibacterium malmesburyense]
MVGNAGPQGRDRFGRGGGVGPCRQRGGGEHRPGPDLEQHLAVDLGERAHALGELHRLTRVPAPIGSVELDTPAERGTGAVVDQDPLWRSETEPLRVRLELVEDRIQQRRVECMAGLEPLTPDPVGRQARDGRLQIRSWPGKHGVGAVVGRDRQAREVVGQVLDPLAPGEHRGHPPARGQAAEQPPPLGDQSRTVLEVEHPRDAGRRVLANAVAQHDVRLETPRLPKPGESHLHREQGGLRVRRLPQRLVGLRAFDIENDVEQRLFEHIGDRRSAPPHGVGEHRLGVEQLAGHAGVLAALAGEQPRRLRRLIAFPANQAGRRAVFGERTEKFGGRVGRVDHKRGAVLQVGTTRTRREAHIAERGIGVFDHPGAVAFGGLA